MDNLLIVYGFSLILVDGFSPTPLKNMQVDWVPNHQPVLVLLCIVVLSWMYYQDEKIMIMIMKLSTYQRFINCYHVYIYICMYIYRQYICVRLHTYMHTCIYTAIENEGKSPFSLGKLTVSHDQRVSWCSLSSICNNGLF